MTFIPKPIPFEQEWPEPDTRLLGAERPAPPELPLEAILSPRWVDWVRSAAEAKSSPPDYVFAAVLAVCGSLVGNTRWAMPWDGWSEPPVLWPMVIGNPSMNKSPGLDAVLGPLRRAERSMREQMRVEIAAYQAQADVAKLVESAWKESVKTAIRNEEELPARPEAADPGPEPVMPRLAVTDATVEKLAVIAAGQPRGLLLARDELAGWLQNMTRYSSGSSDRPFWLEAYGGRAYTVERMGRDPVYVDRLALGVIGGIQPDRFRGLLLKADDDGLLARLMPIWPNPAPIKRPSNRHDEAFLDDVIGRLLSLSMIPDKDGHPQPAITRFTEGAAVLLDAFRIQVRAWEHGVEGPMLSFIGKLPGLAVRLSLVLAMMDWATEEVDEPREITTYYFGRAAHLVESYLLPMARRAYADVDCSDRERAARTLVNLLLEDSTLQFTIRNVQRRGCTRLKSNDEVRAAVQVLEEADIVRSIDQPKNPKGGRSTEPYVVNPQIFRGQE